MRYYSALWAIQNTTTTQGKSAARTRIIKMRKELGLYMNLRPIKLFDELLGASSIKPEILKGADILFFRELTGDIYWRKRKEKDNGWIAMILQNTAAMKWSVLHARRLTQQEPAEKLCSVDKANVIETSRLWREVIQKVALEYPDVEAEHQFVDAMLLLIKRSQTVWCSGNRQFIWDILTDEASIRLRQYGHAGQRIDRRWHGCVWTHPWFGTWYNR